MAESSVPDRKNSEPFRFVNVLYAVGGRFRKNGAAQVKGPVCRDHSTPRRHEHTLKRSSKCTFIMDVSQPRDRKSAEMISGEKSCTSRQSLRNVATEKGLVVSKISSKMFTSHKIEKKIHSQKTDSYKSNSSSNDNWVGTRRLTGCLVLSQM